MYFLVSLFLFFIYPCIIYRLINKYINNNGFINENQININNKQFNIFINPQLSNNLLNTGCNPFYEKIQFNIFLTFEINNEMYNQFIELSSIINNEYNLIEYQNKHYIQFKLYISKKNNDLIKNIIKYIKLVYPTYSKILFIYYDKYPFVYHWFRQNINNFNNDTTRNYYMINIKNILFKLNKDELNVDTYEFESQIYNTNTDQLPEIYNTILLKNKFQIFDDITEELI